MPGVIVRCVMYSYIHQTAYVCWGNRFTEGLNILNGTGEGKVASPAFWRMYILPLIQKLRDHGLGCHIREVFFACILFADDIILICPSRGRAQMLLSICDKWAQ